MTLGLDHLGSQVPGTVTKCACWRPSPVRTRASRRVSKFFLPRPARGGHMRPGTRAQAQLLHTLLTKSPGARRPLRKPPKIPLPSTPKVSFRLRRLTSRPRFEIQTPCLGKPEVRQFDVPFEVQERIPCAGQTCSGKARIASCREESQASNLDRLREGCEGTSVIAKG